MDYALEYQKFVGSSAPSLNMDFDPESNVAQWRLHSHVSFLCLIQNLHVLEEIEVG